MRMSSAYTLIRKRRDEITTDPAMLDAAERERYERFLDPGRREVFLAGRTLIKQSLAPLLGIRPQAVSLSLSSNGKPYLPAVFGPSAPRFNLSHSGDYFVLGIAQSPVGVDVELTRSIGVQALHLFFSAEERTGLEQYSGGEQQRQLLRLFTLKEAFIKAVDRTWNINDVSFRLKDGDWILEGSQGRFLFDSLEESGAFLAVVLDTWA